MKYLNQWETERNEKMLMVNREVLVGKQLLLFGGICMDLVSFGKMVARGTGKTFYVMEKVTTGIGKVFEKLSEVFESLGEEENKQKVVFEIAGQI